MAAPPQFPPFDYERFKRSETHIAIRAPAVLTSEIMKNFAKYVFAR